MFPRTHLFLAFPWILFASCFLILLSIAQNTWAQGPGASGRLPDIALQSGIQDRFSRLRGIAPADYDGDGDLDLFIGNTGDDTGVYWNLGIDQRGDVQLAKGAVLLAGEPVYVTTAADYDNDGDPDVFVGVGGVDTEGLDHLFRNDGGVFIDVTDVAGVAGRLDEDGNPIPAGTGGGAWGDYDRDGWLDLFITNLSAAGSEEQHNILYRNLGDGRFEDVTESAGLADPEGSGWAPSWLDYDNDGWLDVYIANRGEPNLLMRNNGDGSFSNLTTESLADPLVTWGSLTDDFNNDGWMDLLVVARSQENADGDDGMPHGLFINSGGGFSNQTFNSGLNIREDGSTYSTWMGFQAGDLNNDGYSEIFLGAGSPSNGAENHLFMNTTIGDRVRFTIISDSINYEAREDGLEDFPDYPYRTHGTVFADLDGDGDQDLLVGNGGPSTDDETKEPNRLFRVGNTSGHHWLKVNLIGTESNRDGIGARVIVNSSLDGVSSSRHKMVKGISGFGSNNPIQPHFGLGPDDSVESVAVWWPSGRVQRVNNVNIDSSITLTEPSTGLQLTPAEFIARFMSPRQGPGAP